MGLTSLHDSYGSWYMHICRSLFGLWTFFVASIVRDIFLSLQVFVVEGQNTENAKVGIKN